MLLEVGLNSLDQFHPHVGRVADDAIEAATGEHFGKRGAPIKRTIGVGGIVDQAVARLDGRF
jgi:hypothetical protein